MSKIRGELRQLSPARRLLGLLPVLVVALAVAAALGGVGVASADEPEASALAADAGSAAEPAAEAGPAAEADPAPAQTLTATADDGTAVKVEAPAGALPAGTTLHVSAVDNAAVTQAVTDAARADGTELTNVKAYDVTLRDADGAEVEPSAAVKVTFSKTGMTTDDVSVYHVTAPDGNEANASSATELTVNAVDTQKAQANEQVFTTDSFSIYAVGETKPRLKVTFHLNDGSTKVIYVTKKDLENNKLNDIVYDPGCGTLTGKQSFKGWATDTNWNVDTDGLNIEEVRTAVSTKLGELTDNFTDGDKQNGETINYYPIVVTTHRVTYVNEYGAAAKTDEVRVKGGTSANYTVDYAYTPDKSESRFEGWSETQGSTTAEVQNGKTTYSFNDSTADKTLYAVVVDGAWFTFDAQADDATYTAPEFVKYDEKAAKPTNPTRDGYVFGGWYTDKDCTKAYDFNATVGNTTKNTTLYAKWTPNRNATYTINYWKQSVTDDKGVTDHKKKTYDFAGSETASAGTGSKVSGSDTKSEDQDYTGFHYATSDEDVEVLPNGSTVVNVYYDRDLMTINFVNGTTTEQVWHGGTRSTKTGTHWWGGTYTYEVLTIDGTDYEIDTTYDGREYINVGYNTYYIEQNDSEEWGYYANETKDNSTSFTGLYGQTLAQNDYEWPDTTAWYDRSGLNLTFLDAFLFKVNGLTVTKGEGTQTINLNGQALSGDSKINNYKEGTNGEWVLANTLTTGGGTWNVSNKYNGFTVSQYRTYTSGGWGGGSWSNWQNVSVGDQIPSGYSTLELRYTRNKYALTFFDGAYEVPSGEKTLSSSDAPLLTSGNTILYEAPLDEARDADGHLYKGYVPAARDGYIFAGWYKDKACTVPFKFDTTMPLDGTRAYAKWTKLQYDVVLHDGSTDGNEYIGGYETPTDVNYGDRVAEPTSNRGDEWVLVGWYTDAAFTKPYTFDFKLYSTVEENLGIDTSVHTDKNGMTQAYIKGQLNLYAKWRHVLVGAKGITVQYDAGAGNTVNGSQTYTDNSNVYQDGSTAAATSAAKYKDDTQKFQYWVVQQWDSTQNKYVDTDVHVFPGNTFTVNYVDARQTANADNTAAKPSYTYTVQLRAEYGDATPETTTVVFDANGGSGESYAANAVTKTNQNTKSYEVNAQFTIPADPSRDGYEFLGWSGTQKDEWTQDDFDKATDVLALKDAEGNVIAYAADNLTGLAKPSPDGKTNTLYACWKPKYVTLVIQKEMKGAQANLEKGFTFKVTGVDGSIRDYTATTSPLKDPTADSKTQDGQTAPVTELSKDGATVRLRWGDKVTITEGDHVGYETSYSVSNGNGTDDKKGTIELKPTRAEDGTYTTTVVWTNAKENTVVTGIKSAGVPGALTAVGAAALAIAGGFAYVRRGEAGAGAHARRRGRR